MADRARVIAIALAASLSMTQAALAQPGDAALAKYRAALATLTPEGAVVFQYVESRSGPTRALSEMHRVYRDEAGDERNETIAVDGEPVVPALVRITNSPTWAYDPREFAVDAADYDAMPLGSATIAGKKALSFSTVRSSVGDFSVTGLYLDPIRFEPVRETFDAAGDGCDGTGTIDFAIVDRRLMPTVVTVTCKVMPGGSTFQETIRFSDYRFLRSLPSGVFGSTVQ
jgi:hypothetical protein